MRFELFLSKGETKATLNEVFAGIDAAKLRTENVAASPILESVLSLFEPTSFIMFASIFIMFASIRDDHKEMLETWGPTLEITQVVF